MVVEADSSLVVPADVVGMLLELVEEESLDEPVVELLEPVELLELPEEEFVVAEPDTVELVTAMVSTVPKVTIAAKAKVTMAASDFLELILSRI